MTFRPPVIAIVAPSAPIAPETAQAVAALAASRGERAPELRFHPQCFLSSGHFAGSDAARTQAFVDVANDPDVDAVWFARGGYGAGRLLEDAYDQLTGPALAKTYMGYSDAGYVLARLYRDKIGTPVHGPMPADIRRPGGEEAVARALAWLADRDPAALEPSITPEQKTAAFNITVLSHLIGTPAQPDLTGNVLMLEEVSEYMYRIDRALCHIFSVPLMRRVAGVRLGRCSEVPENDPDFGQDEVEVIEYWCARMGVTYLGRADIGHDVGNKVAPFGVLTPAVTTA